jgi:hypothetical protein
VILILQLDGKYVALDIVSEIGFPSGGDDTEVSELMVVLVPDVIVGRKMSIVDCGGMACLNFSWHEACMMVN